MRIVAILEYDGLASAELARQKQTRSVLAAVTETPGVRINN